MNRMTTLSMMLLMISLTACEKEVKYRTPAKTPAESSSASLRIKIPGPNAFPMNGGNAADFLNSYLLRITTNSKKCADYQRYELKDYIGADTLDFTVNTSCSFKVRFAIGKEGNASGLQNEGMAFDAFYTTEESFDIDAEDFEAGDVEIKLHLKRTNLGEKLGFKSEWVKDDLDSGDDKNPGDNEQDEQDSGNDNQNSNSGTTSIAYSDLKSVIDQSCASCHRPGGSRSQSDLSTYAGFKAYGSNAVARIVSGSMPPRGPLSDDLVKKFKDWQSAGFPQKATGSSANTNNNNSSGDERVVEFRIKPGTGSGAWNTQDAPVNLKVGQVLRIINDDTIRHRLHTDGAPCPHGNNIAPGQSEDCVISRPFNGGNLYDHNNLGKFYIRASR